MQKNSEIIIDGEAFDAVEHEFEIRTHHAQSDQDGSRLDRVLAQAVPEFSRSYLQQLLVQGCVTCNEVLQTKSAKTVRLGDVITIVLRPTEQSQAFVPEDIPLDVVFEDAHLLVVNKPAGLVVHPAPGNWRGTLLNGLLQRLPSSRHLPRAGIVHRLDKDTSGLMVVAKTRLCMDALVKLIADRAVSREYVALAHGKWHNMNDVREAADRIVVQSIARDPKNRLKMAAFEPACLHGKPARTDIRLLEQTDSFSWVQCRLHTGRTHQIRVHMAHIGHPLVADGVYGGKLALGMQRQALHALRLAFEHPMTQQALEWLAPIPSDIATALTLMKDT